MAGMGPPPKDPSRRVRNNKDVHPTTRLEFQECEPPELPDDIDWHPRTRAWWNVWQNSPMAVMMGPTDWAFMIDTALMHHDLWSKRQWTLAAEVRLRLAQFGATPADRLRLRIQWADADSKDGRREQAAPVPTRPGYGKLRAMPAPSPQDEAG